MFKGTGARFEVLVNGEVVGRGFSGAGHKENWDYDRFSYSFDTPEQFQSIQIAFTNDEGNAKKDRNLYVKEISINGVAIDLENASNNQEPHSGALYANGRFNVDLAQLQTELKPSTTDADTLIGGLGADELTGGTGTDVFLYKSVAETVGDKISDFVSGEDKIDLALIDANDGEDGDQVFVWRGDQGLTGAAGELYYAASGSDTVLSGDIDGDGVADFSIRLTGTVDLQEVDVLL